MQEKLDELLQKYRAHEMFVDHDIRDFESRGEDGETPLHLVALNGEVEDLTLILPTISNIDTPGGIGHTALHYAIMFGHAAIVDVLLDHGASLSAQNEYGDRPLDLLKEDDAQVLATIVKHRSARAARNLP